jgi:hypothetical protein
VYNNIQKMFLNKLVLATLLSLVFSLRSQSQPHLLVVAGVPGRLFVEHIVDAKENWYSVGRLYNISPKEIAPFNGATLSKPLEIGEHLKIPLTSLNFSQTGLKAAGESLIPVYHTIQPKEWMYHISVQYNKVPIENLEKWNHITRDQAKSGMQLIVGYLKVKTALSALASGIKDQPTANGSVSLPKKEEEKTTSNGVLPQVVKDEKKLEGPPTNQVPVPVTEFKTAENKPSTGIPANTVTATSNVIRHSGGGYFGTEYIRDNKTLTGQAGTFKSTSGWQDSKYYALMNNVPVGTIVKVTSPATNKTIYAKVLGQLPEMKESTGLSIRISNAAAAEIGAGEGKFAVELRY